MMKRSLLCLAALAAAACDVPAIDDVLWSCDDDADCGDGFFCDVARGACVEDGTVVGGEGEGEGEAVGEGEGEGDAGCEDDVDCDDGFYCDDEACADLGPTSAAAGVDATSIHVGLTAALQSGPREEGAAYANGVRAAFGEVNANGGVRHRELVLHARDDGADPVRAAANVAAFVEADGAEESFAVLAASSQVADAAKDAAVAAGRLFFTGRASNNDLADFNQLVFTTRPSLRDETENALRFFISNGDIRVPLENFAVLGEAETGAADAALTALGADIVDAVGDEMARRVLPPATAPEPLVFRYQKNSFDMDGPVAEALAWIAAGGIEANEVGARPIVIVLAGTARPSAAFVESMLDSFHDIKLGNVAGSAFGLSDADVTKLQNVENLYFWAPAEVGLDTLSAETSAFGTYTTVAGEEDYCARVISTQVVPTVAPASSAQAYITALAAVDPNAVPTRAGFEGYITAKTLIAGLNAVAPEIETAAVVSALEGLAAVDFGSGSIDFSASSHVGAEDFYGVGFGAACAGTDLDLDLPDQPPAVSECPGGVCLIQGVLFGDDNTNTVTFRSTFEYLLRGTVFVGDDTNETRLVIEPGTVIKGDFETTGTLVIRRGSKIIADGTEADPILFTSEKAPGQRATGDWGGIVINGRAPLNCNPGVLLAEGTTDAGGACQGIGEGASGLYGGNDEDDDSGVLRFVRVEFAGKKITDATSGIENELNGIAFQGVGRSTVVDFVHVHRGQDDAVEFFGGTVDAKHLLLTCADDDSLDWVGGFRGRVQYVVVQQCADHGDNGFEADNRKLGNADLPRSRPIIANATVIGLNSADAVHSNFGALIREGTHATIANSAFIGFNKDCLDIDQPATFSEAATVDGVTGDVTPTGNFVMTGVTFACTSNFEEEAGDAFTVQDFFEAGVANSTAGVGTQLVSNAFQQVDATGNAARFNPPGGSALLSGAQTFTDLYVDEGAFFDVVTYRGGVDPADDWTRGWTSFPEN